jgi:hypothetical protein
MSFILSSLLAVSLAALVFGVAYLEYRRGHNRRVASSALLLVVALGVFAYLKADTVETKGPAEEAIAVVVCYAAMLLGMAAEYGYSEAERGDKAFKWDMRFLMPIFASPIVFIPLLTITTEMTLGGAFTKSKLMVYLVAFQNGFFWKSFFEERRQRALEGVAASAAEIPKPVRHVRTRAARAK